MTSGATLNQEPLTKGQGLRDPLIPISLAFDSWFSSSYPMAGTREAWGFLELETYITVSMF